MNPWLSRGLIINMKILLIEDSVRLQKSIGLALKKSGYATDITGDGEDGLWMAESGAYDVIILDLMLPNKDGLTILKTLRDKGVNTHVLILTAKVAVDDRVRGLETGADDYLTKPFSIDELLARVGALVRRKYEQKNPALSIGNLQLDLNKREVQIGNTPLALAPREYKLLEYLCHRAGTVVARPEIESHIYEEASEIFSNAIDSTISILRKKMATVGCTLQISTRRGMGYVLELAPE